MQNTYHFSLILWTGESLFSPPIHAANYKEALSLVYQDSRIIGTQLKALKLWGGLIIVKQADLFNPCIYDVNL